MNITDLFIRRPVLATVISLLILVLGLRAMMLLPVRQFPYTQNAVVTVTTYYVGADPEIVAGFITTPLENSISQANGIDYLTSTSTIGSSIIQANLRLNYDANTALSEINTKVNAVLNLLPKDAQPPVLSVQVGESIDSMYIGFYSDVLANNQITDYILRVVQPKLQAVEGVQVAEIIGSRQFAMRAWLNPEKMAGFGVTSTDVANALANNDFISAVGRTDGQMVTVNLTAETGLHSVEEFKNLIIKAQNGAIIRLGDIANVTLGAENYDVSVKFDNNGAVYVGIKVVPSANLLTTIDNIRKIFPSIEQQFPEGLQGKIVYDATKYVYSAIHEVEESLIEAILIVTLVIYLFLGSIRSVFIPVVAIPLSLIGAFFMMYILGYSINLLTLLALVLAIGLVVDDAIIVVENIHRHMEAGMSRLNAALLGAKELANPIIAISIVLIAVYVPIGFMTGLTGALFKEFAFTLAGSVAVSAIVAITLSPMMCAKLLTVAHKAENNGNNPSIADKITHFVDKQFERMRTYYEEKLAHALNNLSVVIVFSIIVFISIYFLFITSERELAPEEDQGVLITNIKAAPNANLAQTELFSKEVFNIFHSYSETSHVFQIAGYAGFNSEIAGMVLKPWDERKKTAMELQPELQAKLSNIAGLNIAIFQRPPLPGSFGLPVQFVLGATESYTHLNDVSQAVLEKARATGKFLYIDKDLKIDKQQTTVKIDRDKAAQLGLDMHDVGSVLAWNLGANYINFFSLGGRSYKVIPQVLRSDRLNANQLLDFYIKTANGTAIPISTIVKLENKVVPQSLTHFQQLNSATISGIPFPGVTLGEAVETLAKIANETMPEGYSIDYAGQARQFIQEGAALILTFFFALLVIYLTLAALFESFRDPLIVLISVPMSIFGAMIFINLGIGGASINIYTQVGLVTLIGLISKHGILIVQFANDLQREGHDLRTAVMMASGIRLRPILMTTASMVLGVVPLILATGAGAVSRYNIGLVVMTGISIGTFFTLFVVPAMYLLLAEKIEPEVSQNQDEIVLGAIKPN